MKKVVLTKEDEKKSWDEFIRKDTEDDEDKFICDGCGRVDHDMMTTCFKCYEEICGQCSHLSLCESCEEDELEERMKIIKTRVGHKQEQEKEKEKKQVQVKLNGYEITISLEDLADLLQKLKK